MKPPRANLKITLRDVPLLIPYPAIEYSVGRIGISYRSLLDDPAAIDEFPELYNEPDLKAFIAEVNGLGKAYETVRLPLGQSRNVSRVSFRRGAATRSDSSSPLERSLPRGENPRVVH